MPVYPGVLSLSASAPGAGGIPYGLIDFGNDNNTKYYAVSGASPSLLDLSAGAWAWGAWTRVTENSGSNSQTLIGSGASGATPSFNLYLVESGAASNANSWRFNIKDNAGVSANTGATATGADSVLRLIIVQSTGTTVEMWHCPVNGTAARVVNLATNLGALTAPSAWNFGRISDGQNLQYYESEAGGFFKANVALTQSEIELIAGGSSPVTVLGANCIEYWPFKNKVLGDNQIGSVHALTATYTVAGAATVPEFVQAGTGFSQPTAQSSHTFAYTCAVSPGSNRLLALCFAYKANTETFDTITYNGVTLSQAVIFRRTATSPDIGAAIYYLLNANVPNDGASHNFVIDFSGANTGQLWAIPLEYKNVKQAAPHRTGTLEGNAAPWDISLTTVAAEAMLLDSFMSNGTNGSSTPGTNQNERYDVGTSAGSFFASDKLPAGHSGGTVSMTQSPTTTTASFAYVAASWEKV